MIKVGQELIADVEFRLDGVAVTTGTATLAIWRWFGAAQQWLQADGVTFSSTYHAFGIVYNAVSESWLFQLPAPSSSAGYTLAWEMIHNNTDLLPATGSIEIYNNSIDDVSTQISGIPVAVWSMGLPGSFVIGTAGYLVGNPNTGSAPIIIPSAVIEVVANQQPIEVSNVTSVIEVVELP